MFSQACVTHSVQLQGGGGGVTPGPGQVTTPTSRTRSGYNTRPPRIRSGYNTPPPNVVRRAVPILLECILVLECIRYRACSHVVLFVPRLRPAQHDGVVGVQGGGSHHTPRAQVASLLPDSQREHVVAILRGSTGRMRNNM